MITENGMIMISEDEYQSHMDEEFNNGWSEFKHLTIDYLSQFDKIGSVLIEDIEDLC